VAGEQGVPSHGACLHDVPRTTAHTCVRVCVWGRGQMWHAGARRGAHATKAVHTLYGRQFNTSAGIFPVQRRRQHDRAAQCRTTRPKRKMWKWLRSKPLRACAPHHGGRPAEQRRRQPGQRAKAALALPALPLPTPQRDRQPCAHLAPAQPVHDGSSLVGVAFMVNHGVLLQGATRRRQRG
jgi:hypothetical protein